MRSRFAAAVGTLYELTKLSDADFFEKLAAGTIKPDMQREAIALANRLARRRVDEERVKRLVHIEGKFPTLVIDPGWTYGSPGRAAPDYATMSLQEIFAIPVLKWAAPRAHLYLWTTDEFLGTALELVRHYGFEEQAVITWCKPGLGRGSHFRHTSEFVIFGVRGGLQARVHDIGTHFTAPVGRHSEKPEAFYDIVRKISFPPYGEAFQRKARPDFVNLYETKTDALTTNGSAITLPATSRT